MYKKIEEIDMKKMMRVIATAYDEQKEIKTADQLREHIVQFSNEISEVAIGLSHEDAALVHHKAFETLKRFEDEPSLRQLF